jgi:hypothetical protein
MSVSQKLATSSYSRKNITFPTSRIIANLLHHRRFKDKKTTIDPRIITVRLFLKASN